MKFLSASSMKGYHHHKSEVSQANNWLSSLHYALIYFLTFFFQVWNALLFFLILFPLHFQNCRRCGVHQFTSFIIVAVGFVARTIFAYEIYYLVVLHWASIGLDGLKHSWSPFMVFCLNINCSTLMLEGNFPAF